MSCMMTILACYALWLVHGYTTLSLTLSLSLPIIVMQYNLALLFWFGTFRLASPHNNKPTDQTTKKLYADTFKWNGVATHFQFEIKYLFKFKTGKNSWNGSRIMQQECVILNCPCEWVYNVHFNPREVWSGLFDIGTWEWNDCMWSIHVSSKYFQDIIIILMETGSFLMKEEEDECKKIQSIVAIIK